MKKMVLIIAACLFLMGCEKVILNEDFSEMRGFYAESCSLSTVSLDSVKSFKRKVDAYTAIFPASKETSLYPKIKENIRNASLRITLECDSTWDEPITINFDFDEGDLK